MKREKDTAAQDVKQSAASKRRNSKNGKTQAPETIVIQPEGTSGQVIRNYDARQYFDEDEAWRAEKKAFADKEAQHKARQAKFKTKVIEGATPRLTEGAKIHSTVVTRRHVSWRSVASVLKSPEWADELLDRHAAELGIPVKTSTYVRVWVKF